MRLLTSTRIAGRARRGLHNRPIRQSFFTSSRQQGNVGRLRRVPVILLAAGVLIWLDSTRHSAEDKKLAPKLHPKRSPTAKEAGAGGETAAWSTFSKSFENLSNATDIEWVALSERIVGYILPEWSKLIPTYLRKLQQELSGERGSLADEIWREAHDPLLHPETQYSAHVRVSDALCDEEKEFLKRRKRVAKIALAKYLDIDEKDIHPDDVPTIAVCGSGGGLRALVAGTGSLLAAEKDGLLDCVTYTAGVSGSCWLQSIYFSTIGMGSMQRVLDHIKGRTGTHIAYPPVALETLISAPTDRYLLSGIVEKLKGDEGADFGLVDVYGLLLAARLLVPVGDLEVDHRDLKISNQQEYIKYGQNPLPIYTAVRHEIPEATDSKYTSAPEDAKERAKREAWFQWFEITPYELFCEEFSAGIPAWAIGRKFKNGTNVIPEEGLFHPETRMSLLLGVFGSAFCATLNHYYQEIRPVVKGLAGFGTVDDLISGRNQDLSKVHPIDPATIPNFAYGMDGKLPKTAPESIFKNEYIQLMDAGMSNNLPIYPLLRPGRDVDIVIAFDNSADVRQDNWLAVTDGYARQRNVRGWPIGVGWPKDEVAEETGKELDLAAAGSTPGARGQAAEAKYQEAKGRAMNGSSSAAQSSQGSNQDKEGKGLGYCTIWVGTKEERSSAPPPPSKALDESDSWTAISAPTAGLALVYLPLIPNPRVPGVDPQTTDFLSTWNFVYTPDQVDDVANLAKANYDEGREHIKMCVRAVYDRRRAQRLEREERKWEERFRSLVRKGITHSLGEGDHFS
ncbi:related to phospholipase A2, cytosolic [Cephalotrichum gorgonifer]|uniref:Lysophospholipase n=1 Tax=Cephalotrichum gorgonifer TaxID=2041049 RepID=A0AAE8SSA5_9PEZI|nr:related to phospholipase A2, cytosolic [Cephalotrichum gorgonifer]